jgi:Autotransporter beta-domain/Protein of unknwon function (DUF3310)
MADNINHPKHYGGEDDPYEAIKVVEAWQLSFHLGNVVKYISRAGKKGDVLEDLKKAHWYLDREITNREVKRQHYAALQTQWFHTPNYRETDLTGGGFGLAYNGMTANDTRSELGARFDYLRLVDGMPLLLRARVAWAHDWVSNPSLTATFQILPGASFIVNGAGVPNDSALMTAGATLQVNKNLSVEAKFDGQFANTSQIYAGTGTVRYAR